MKKTLLSLMAIMALTISASADAVSDLDLVEDGPIGCVSAMPAPLTYEESIASSIPDESWSNYEMDKWKAVRAKYDAITLASAE